MNGYVIKYRDMYLAEYHVDFSDRIIDFRFNDCFDNAIHFVTLEQARNIQQSIGIGKINKHVVVFEPVDY